MELHTVAFVIFGVGLLLFFCGKTGLATFISLLLAMLMVVPAFTHSTNLTTLFIR